MRGRNQTLPSEVDQLSGALQAAQSSTQFVQNQSQAHIASLAFRSQSAVDENATLTARIDLMKSLHNSEISEKEKLMTDENISFQRYFGDSQEKVT